MRVLPVFLLLLVTQGPAAQGDAGRAVVAVVTEPEVDGDTLRFEGIPSGVISLGAGSERLEASGLAAGTYVTTLAAMGPTLVGGGYEVTGVTCDDGRSAAPSVGDAMARTATFRVEAGETVTCVFTLAASACVCPREGAWAVSNLPGSMVCTGAVSMTAPLAPGTERGRLEVRDGCATVVATGMGEGTAPITMRRGAGCAYRGTVGGERDGIPMEIHFTWTVEDPSFITGELSSEVSQQGMTCVMSRAYELRFAE